MSKSRQAQKLLADYPTSENWRLFIDGYRQREGKWAFDSGAGAERGYYAAMQGSWDRMLNTMDKSLSVAELKNIHDYCVGKGAGQNAVEGVDDVTEYRTAQADFGLVTQTSDVMLGNVSIEGAEEFFQRKLNNDPNSPPVRLVYFDERGFTREFTMDPTASARQNAENFCAAIDERGGKLLVTGNAEEFVARYIKEYNTAIKHASADDEKLLAIANCVSQIEKLHPFYDGNCRTMLILTNKLLLQNGLSPCIYENPNRIDMFSKEQIVDEIKRGQVLFNEYKITAAARKLESLSPEQLNDEVKVLKTINNRISAQPLQSLEQLSQLYEKIRNHEIALQKAPPPVEEGRRRGLFSSHETKGLAIKHAKAENVILNCIQSIYADRINSLKTTIELIHDEVDLLRAQRVELQNEQARITDLITISAPEGRKALVDELQAVEGDLSGLNRKLDRASKAEQWLVDRFDEIEHDHKKVLSEHTSIEHPNTLKTAFNEIHQLARRETDEPTTQLGMS